MMKTASSIDWEDLEDDFDAVPTTKDTREKFPCGRCGGTGEYRGVRIYQEKQHCFACKGKGYFLTSPEFRAKAKAQRRAAKMRKQEEEQARRQAIADKWFSENESIANYLREVATWNDFALQMINAVERFGSLTEGQLKAVNNMKAKHDARQAEKAENKATIDLSRILELIGTAKESGLKKPKLRVGKLAISVAPSHGKNAGHLYVKDSGEYAGKITPEGKFFGLRSARTEIEGELIEIAGDPLKAATIHGQQTGQCACCGRELTNKESIELGIGPICKNKWGM